jgi:choline dehydrogenase-like flavoprotein
MLTENAQAYYQPNKERSNLKVLVGAHVQRVQTEKDSGGNLKATAVEFTHGGKTCTVNVNKEVLLTAGYDLLLL